MRSKRSACWSAIAVASVVCTWLAGARVGRAGAANLAGGAGNRAGSAARRSTETRTTITLYNGQHPELTTAIVRAFEKKTGIDVRVRTDDGVVLADQILEEGHRSPADVYLTENSPELVLLGQRHLLSPLPAPVLHQVPARYDSPNGTWVGVALRVNALAYDPHLVRASQLPDHLLDLAEPRWKGKVAIAPTDSDFLPLVGAVLATYGKKAALAWLKGLKANSALYGDDESVAAAVNRGGAAVGIINQYYWYRLEVEVGARGMHSRLYFFPHRDIGNLEDVAGAAVLVSSRHKGAADRFVAFLVSAEAQHILASGDDFEYPARPGVPPNPALLPLARVKPAELSVVKLGDDRPAASLLAEAGLV